MRYVDVRIGRPGPGSTKGRRGARDVIQLVCVMWGTKYGAKAVNRLFRAAKRGTTAPFRFVCIAENPNQDFDDDIDVRPFPRFALPFETLRRGCRLKLSVFAPGVLEPDLPTVYLDLDTVLRGDVARIGEQLQRKPGLYMLPNHYVQFWRIQKYLPAIGIHKYYFGNSSVLAFHPGRFHFVFDAFNRLASELKSPYPRYLSSDERFISYIARGHVRVFPKRLVVKFAEEYMLPFLFLEEARSRLPWVAARRRDLVAVTFVGLDFKPARLAALKDGEIVRYKRLKYRWRSNEYQTYWLDPA